MSGDQDKLECIRRAIGGDQVALTVLLTESETRLQSRLRPRMPADLRSTLDVDDLLQEIYSDIFRNIERFEPRGEDSFDRWVATIALRRLRAEIRRHRAAKRGGRCTPVRHAGTVADESTVTLLNLIEASDRSPSRTAAGSEAVAAVEAAMGLLPENYRAAVRLVYLEGSTVAEAARALGRSERAIHNLCHKAKEKLRNMLGPQSRYLSSSG
ncbi:MAG: RNA polymerase sigma factor [Phycisphaerales bacterium]|nr:RNA polymerase sigma factor [Phycisphaerales bacterium]